MENVLEENEAMEEESESVLFGLNLKENTMENENLIRLREDEAEFQIRQFRSSIERKEKTFETRIYICDYTNEQNENIFVDIGEAHVSYNDDSQRELKMTIQLKSNNYEFRITVTHSSVAGFEEENYSVEMKNVRHTIDDLNKLKEKEFDVNDTNEHRRLSFWFIVEGNADYCLFINRVKQIATISTVGNEDRSRPMSYDNSIILNPEGYHYDLNNIDSEFFENLKSYFDLASRSQTLEERLILFLKKKNVLNEIFNHYNNLIQHPIDIRNITKDENVILYIEEEMPKKQTYDEELKITKIDLINGKINEDEELLFLESIRSFGGDYETFVDMTMEWSRKIKDVFCFFETLMLIENDNLFDLIFTNESMMKMFEMYTNDPYSTTKKPIDYVKEYSKTTIEQIVPYPTHVLSELQRISKLIFFENVIVSHKFNNIDYLHKFEGYVCRSRMKVLQQMMNTNGLMEQMHQKFLRGTKEEKLRVMKFIFSQTKMFREYVGKFNQQLPVTFEDEMVLFKLTLSAIQSQQYEIRSYAIEIINDFTQIFSMACTLAMFSKSLNISEYPIVTITKQFLIEPNRTLMKRICEQIISFIKSDFIKSTEKEKREYSTIIFANVMPLLHKPIAIANDSSVEYAKYMKSEDDKKRYECLLTCLFELFGHCFQFHNSLAFWKYQGGLNVIETIKKYLFCENQTLIVEALKCTKMIFETFDTQFIKMLQEKEFIQTLLRKDFEQPENGIITAIISSIFDILVSSERYYQLVITADKYLLNTLKFKINASGTEEMKILYKKYVNLFIGYKQKFGQKEVKNETIEKIPTLQKSGSFLSSLLSGKQDLKRMSETNQNQINQHIGNGKRKSYGGEMIGNNPDDNEGMLRLGLFSK